MKLLKIFLQLILSKSVMKDLTVMLSACGAQFAPGMVNCLKDNGFLGRDNVLFDCITGRSLYEIAQC